MGALLLSAGFPGFPYFWRMLREEVVVTVLIPVCSSWGDVRGLLRLWRVALSPIEMHGCVFCNAHGCRYWLRQEPGAACPPATTSLRVGVLPWCSLPFVLQSLCFEFSIVTLGEGVYISTFPCVQSMCRSSRLGWSGRSYGSCGL